MTASFTCGDKDTLVAYLYDELDPPARRRVEDHLRSCAECASEAAALKDVRVDLAAWAPPQPELGFTIVQASRAPSPEFPARIGWPARGWPREVPAWAQAIAAILVLAVGAAIANVQIRYDAGGLAITTGWLAPTFQAPSADEAWQPALAELASTLRREMRQRDEATSAAVPAAVRPSLDGDQTLRRMAAMIEQSERRQRQELALRLTQFGRDFDVQRRSDLMRINQVFGQFEGRTGAEVARQRQMLDYIVRVSQPQQ
jgi:hypothetical protein